MNRAYSPLVLVIIAAVAGRAHGQVWTQTGATSGSWGAVAGSADGTKLAAVNGTHIYTSSDSGADWVPTSAPSRSWSALASSPDGSILLAAAPGGPPYGGVYCSTNFGNTWQTNSLPTYPQWDAAAISANGNMLVIAGQVAGSVYYSTNLGANWNSNGTPSGYWTSVACSADGSKLAAAWSGTIYVSTNFGVNWTNYVTSGGSYLACSADGSRLMLWSPGHLWVSTNWGATLASATVPNPSSSLMLGGSADLKRLVGLVGSALYISTNFGTTWTTNYAPSKNWKSIALTADGTQMVASTTSSSDLVYAWRPPVLNATNAAGNVVLSWSTNGTPFGLQMNSDLSPANWITVTNPATITNFQNQVTLPQTNSAGFFRLISQ